MILPQLPQNERTQTLVPVGKNTVDSARYLTSIRPLMVDTLKRNGERTMKRSVVVIAIGMFALLSSAEVSRAQRPWYRGNVLEIIRQLETNTDRYKSSLDKGLDDSRLNGTRAEDEINAFVKRFEEATDRLRNNAEDQQHAPRAAREVLNRGRAINRFMTNNRLGARAEGDWTRVKNDLNRLATAYHIRWRW